LADGTDNPEYLQAGVFLCAKLKSIVALETTGARAAAVGV
jgi:hypothetical protein